MNFAKKLAGLVLVVGGLLVAGLAFCLQGDASAAAPT